LRLDSKWSEFSHLQTRCAKKTRLVWSITNAFYDKCISRQKYRCWSVIRRCWYISSLASPVNDDIFVFPVLNMIYITDYMFIIVMTSECVKWHMILQSTLLAAPGQRRYCICAYVNRSGQMVKTENVFNWTMMNCFWPLHVCMFRSTVLFWLD